MIRTNRRTRMSIAGALSLGIIGPLAAVGSAQADTIVTCYASIHEYCYPPGRDAHCSPEEYDFALDLCDEIFTHEAERPAPPANLATGTETRPDPKILRELRSTVERKFGKPDRSKRN
ncbi:hypothetical protein HBA54_25580 [Pelagibius litoralis]|uniref:Uncharacterized protein n=1 Tax=Pelagibius litoralis TaxID=374515 RepID=A0A967F322_9PROT|nr:hypothetical protein [Pelagibius litoralis]NIA71976.1 hypothetical protein [Pelagibius litoralis]